MKKLIGILTIATVAATLCFTTNPNDPSDSDLASIIAINIANAEMDPDGDHCSKENNAICYVGEGLSFPGCNEDTWYSSSDCF